MAKRQRINTKTHRKMEGCVAAKSSSGKWNHKIVGDGDQLWMRIRLSQSCRDLKERSEKIFDSLSLKFTWLLFSTDCWVLWIVITWKQLYFLSFSFPLNNSKQHRYEELMTWKTDIKVNFEKKDRGHWVELALWHLPVNPFISWF